MWSALVIRALQSDAVSQVLSKRSDEELVTQTPDSPHPVKDGFGLAALIINWILAVSVSLTLTYTLYNLFPILTIVEDDSPSTSYSPVPTSNKQDEELEELTSMDGKDTFIDAEEGSSTPRSKPITSSVRSIYFHLLSISGGRSLFRGCVCYMAHAASVLVIGLSFGLLPFVPDIVAFTVAGLLTIPLETAWTHIVISKPSEKRFWRRLPKFGPAFRATALPTVVVYVVEWLTQNLPLSLALGLYGQTPDPQAAFPWMLLLLLYLLASVFLVLPLQMVLVRAQASLLPDDEQTIVPFDRAFKLNKVEGKGYMSMLDAWRSFSRPAWVRLLKLYAKGFAIMTVVHFGLIALAAVEFFIIYRVF
ncbi:hypothetical protein F4677DRAFT_126733 [Hypoxylon crocopeplum]|nr:hypothetical protein F4677DRAFT_126733 [Hypoxylon crocopeplum]